VVADVSFRGSALLELVEGDEMRRFTEALLADGAPAPEIGEEHLDGFAAELAWPSVRVAVFPDPMNRIDPSESVAAYRKAGWRADTMTDWDRDELLNLVKNGSTPTEEDLSERR